MTIFLKVVLCGEIGVGKTALCKNFMGLSFNTQYVSTIGADFSIKEMDVDTQKGRVTFHYQIWDLAGQINYKEIRSRNYYRGASGALVVFDITRKDTLENITNWLLELKSVFKNNPIPVILLGNKIDKRNSEALYIQTSEGLEFAKNMVPFYYGEKSKKEIPFFETSALTGVNVEVAFIKLGELIMNEFKEPDIQTSL